MATTASKGECDEFHRLLHRYQALGVSAVAQSCLIALIRVELERFAPALDFSGDDDDVIASEQAEAAYELEYASVATWSAPQQLLFLQGVPGLLTEANRLLVEEPITTTLSTIMHLTESL
jgi:hypothetical protein